MKTSFVTLCLLGLLGASGSLALAQDTIRTSQPPPAPPARAPLTAEPAQVLRQAETIRIDLPYLFEDDPVTVPYRATGRRPASELSPQCQGFVGTRPEISFSYQAGHLPLFISAGNNRTAVLAVRLPDDSWLCPDGRRGQSRGRLVIPAPRSGRYEIWLGTRESGGEASGTLTLSERGLQPYAPALPGQSVAAINASAQLHSRAQADFGQLQIRPGESRPQARLVRAGGQVRASLAGDPGCQGYVDPRPTLIFDNRALTAVDIYARGSIDTVLFVQLPDGSWVCDDDGAAGFNAGLRLHTPQIGRHAIYLGALSLSGGDAELVVEPAAQRRVIGPKARR